MPYVRSCAPWVGPASFCAIHRRGRRGRAFPELCGPALASDRGAAGFRQHDTRIGFSRSTGARVGRAQVMRPLPWHGGQVHARNGFGAGWHKHAGRTTAKGSGERMPRVRTDDGVEIYFEEAGSGDPILFLHEFGGHHLSWEPQLRFFSRRYRCITYAARGWPPSDIPEEPDAYSQARAADDAAAVLKGLGLARAHLVGLSMGATAALEFGIRHPQMALSLTAAAAGSGASLGPVAKRPLPRAR